MKQLPNDVVAGGRYVMGENAVYVTAVAPKGRGFYVEYHSATPGYCFGDGKSRMSLERFRRACNVTQRESA